MLDFFGGIYTINKHFIIVAAMSGALVALISKGIQDTYVLNPTKYKASYKRFTDFSQAVHRLPVSGSIVAGGTSEVEVIFKGDVINAMWLEVPNENNTLDGTEFELYIGGKLVDTITYDYCVDIWSVYLAENRSKATVINNAISTSDVTFFPLHFFFCDYDNFLPLVALSNTSVSVRIKWGNSSNLSSNLKVFGNFIFLSEDTRLQMVKGVKEFFVTQVQKLTLSESSGTMSADLSSLNHPIKYLFWGHPSKSDELDKDYFSFKDAKISINGLDIMDSMSPSYYHTVQSYYNNSNALINFVNSVNCPFYTRFFIYNFGKSCCNFSRLDSASLTLTDVTRGTDRTNEKLYVYAVGYNVLKITAGLAGILFSN